MLVGQYKMCRSGPGPNDGAIVLGIKIAFRLWLSKKSESIFKVQWKTKGLLIISSLLNAAICYFSFWTMVFATSPNMDDVTMRVGFYVVNLITASALAAIFLPWILAYRNRNKTAAFVAMLPVLLICLAVLAFVTLDSWLNRTFSSMGATTLLVASVETAEHAKF